MRVLALDDFDCRDFTCVAEWIGDGSAILVVKGELDMHNSTEVNRVLEGLDPRVADGGLIVDLSDCGFIDSIGLSVLIAAQSRSSSPLGVVVTSRALRRVFTVTGLTSVFTLYETRAQAIAGLQERDETR